MIACRLFPLCVAALASCTLTQEAIKPAPAAAAGAMTADKPHPSSPWAAPADYAAYHRRIGEPVAGTVPDGDETVMPSGDRVYRHRGTGRITGSASTSPSGTTTFRDTEGRIVGNSSTSSGGNTTHRDGDGRITLTSDTTPGTGGDSTTPYRRGGVIVGQKYVSPAGHITWRDGSGRIIGGPGEFKP